MTRSSRQCSLCSSNYSGAEAHKRTGTKQRSDDRTTNLNRLIMDNNLICCVVAARLAFSMLVPEGRGAENHMMARCGGGAWLFFCWG